MVMLTVMPLLTGHCRRIDPLDRQRTNLLGMALRALILPSMFCREDSRLLDSMSPRSPSQLNSFEVEKKGRLFQDVLANG